MLDDVTGNDPGVALRPANEFGKRLPGPDKVDLLDVVQVYAVSVVLAAEVCSRCVVECVDESLIDAVTALSGSAYTLSGVPPTFRPRGWSGQSVSSIRMPAISAGLSSTPASSSRIT